MNHASDLVLIGSTLLLLLGALAGPNLLDLLQDNADQSFSYARPVKPDRANRKSPTNKKPGELQAHRVSGIHAGPVARLKHWPYFTESRASARILLKVALGCMTSHTFSMGGW